MGSIFLSYSHNDRPRIGAIVEALEHAGHDVWWDLKIPIGHTYQEYIGLKLSEVDAVVVAWSPHSVASNYVLWEATKAWGRGVYVPILLEPTELPPEFFKIQAADLTDWSGETSHPEWGRLLNALGGGEPGDVSVDGSVPAIEPPDVGRTRMPSAKSLKKRTKDRRPDEASG
jgi:hypothetical protein